MGRIMIDVDPLKENLAGIQLAMFELIWPAFTWIKGIYGGGGPQKYLVHVQADAPPSDAEWDGCVRQLNEIFACVAEKFEIVRIRRSRMHRSSADGYGFQGNYLAGNI